MKIVFDYIKNAKKEIEQKTREKCRIEYSNYAYDIVCGEYFKTYYKVKRLRGETIIITYAEYLDAIEVYEKLYILVVNELGKILLKIPFKEAILQFYGIINGRYINYNGKIIKLRISIVAGRKGKMVPVFLSMDDWGKVFKRLKVSHNPIDYLRRRLVD